MMIIKKNKAVLINFDTDKNKFKSDYERNKFYRGLHGWKQIIPAEKGNYCYDRKGLLNDIPHIKVADSAFIVELRNMQKMMDYFEEWADKVHCEMMRITLDHMKITEMRKKGHHVEIE